MLKVTILHFVKPKKKTPQKEALRMNYQKISLIFSNIRMSLNVIDPYFEIKPSGIAIIDFLSYVYFWSPCINLHSIQNFFAPDKGNSSEKYENFSVSEES